jgi:D-inositol-3-phosphate glycosyltransferase
MRWMYHAPPHKIVVVPPGVNLLRFHPVAPGAAREALGLTRHCRMLLFVGRIEPLKGVDVIFQALAILKREAPDLVSNLCLSVIGGDPDHPAGQNAEMERLKHLRSQLELDGVVVFLGSKDQDTLNTYYAAAEALIMPSDYESFGMVALEAMASGTPVIASAVGGLAFLVRDGINGYLVPVREPAALAARIRLLLENPAQRAQLGATAAQDATAYAWPRIADQLLNVFGSVSEARRKIVAQ